MFARWPKPLEDDFKAHYRLETEVERGMDARFDLVGRGRNLRRELNLAANRKVRFVFKTKDPVAPEDADVIRLLLNAEELDVDPNYSAPKGTPSALTELGELFLPREGQVDESAERDRLTKELGKIQAEIIKVESKLGNPAFVGKAPPHVLEEHRKRLADWQAKERQVREALDRLGSGPLE
jgi:valyl-tRNA synthetase